MKPTLGKIRERCVSKAVFEKIEDFVARYPDCTEEEAFLAGYAGDQTPLIDTIIARRAKPEAHDQA